MLYPIFVFINESGTYDGYFPDVDGCFFSGDNLEAAVRDAETAFGQHMEVFTEMGNPVVVPRDPAAWLGDSRLKEDSGFLTLIELDPAKYERKAIKFNLTMPGNLLTAIDRYIEKNGHFRNRSSFLSELARKELARG
ncbi:HicB family protein [Erwinia sp. E602]|uniref:type II toxin-antitoxin system HicB family antitoxin n=1 Tax=Erwinia sp. E602 TaxID=2675378 RepID=UPI001BAB50CF|nr:type II toxin-antitoxin system HicB family antitoxin [Erwinia sp. E602]QUG75381.1 HicB family protein [Erwinia sp. E602]